MGKAMFFLVAILVLGVVIILYKGSQVAVPVESDSTPIEGPSMPDLKLKERASAAGEAIKDGAKKAATAAGALKEVKPSIYKFDREIVEVRAGGTSELKITRSGGEMKAQTFELLPAPGSSITASGGAFKAGEASAVIVVEAKPGAQDAGLTVRTTDFTKVIPVRVSK